MPGRQNAAAAAAAADAARRIQPLPPRRPGAAPVHPVRLELFRRRYTLHDLGRAAGYNPATVQNVLSGHQKSWPRFRSSIAAALGRPEHELFPEIKT